LIVVSRHNYTDVKAFDFINIKWNRCHESIALAI
jgi:hypothetical protein